MDRAEKEREVVATAGELALTSGPDAVTVSSVARRLGLARNAVTWYFPTRDDLLAATFRHLTAEAVADPPPRLQLNGQLEWAIGRLADLRPLYLHLGARAAESSVAAEVIRETQDRLYAMLAHSLRTRIAPEDVDNAAALLGVFVEGLLAGPAHPGSGLRSSGSATARLAPPVARRRRAVNARSIPSRPRVTPTIESPVVSTSLSPLRSDARADDW